MKLFADCNIFFLLSSCPPPVRFEIISVRTLRDSPEETYNVALPSSRRRRRRRPYTRCYRARRFPNLLRVNPFGMIIIGLYIYMPTPGNVPYSNNRVTKRKKECSIRSRRGSTIQTVRVRIIYVTVSGQVQSSICANANRHFPQRVHVLSLGSLFVRRPNFPANEFHSYLYAAINRYYRQNDSKAKFQ